MAYCSKCGDQVALEAAFCRVCGTAVFASANSQPAHPSVQVVSATNDEASKSSQSSSYEAGRNFARELRNPNIPFAQKTMLILRHVLRHWFWYGIVLLAIMGLLSEQQKPDSQKDHFYLFIANYFYLFMAVISGTWVWHKFIRRRCQKCKATSPALINMRELDSWLGTKEVTENLGGGKTRKRIMNATFSKVERTYKCASCGNEWDEVSKEEKSNLS
jgi:uncharacterized membrane protein YvbJ